MKYKIRPEYGAKIKEEIVVVGHIGELVFARDEMGKLYYQEDKNQNMEIGTCCEKEEMKLVDELTEAAKKIYEHFGEEVI